jgi:hypothetical protein
MFVFRADRGRGGNPSSAVSARISRRLLPSPSAAGLLDYPLTLPPRLPQPEAVEAELEPIPTRAETGADLDWVIHGPNA